MPIHDGRHDIGDQKTSVLHEAPNGVNFFVRQCHHPGQDKHPGSPLGQSAVHDLVRRDKVGLEIDAFEQVAVGVHVPQVPHFVGRDPRVLYLCTVERFVTRHRDVTLASAGDPGRLQRTL